jgi:hypothetical protein
VEKKQRHPVSGRHADKFALAFCCPKTFSAPHDSVQFLEQLDLLIDQ